MGARLQALLELQTIEHQIVDIRREFRQKERLVAAQQKKRDAALAAFQAEQAEIRRQQLHFDEIDVDLKARSGHINRLREHLNTVRTNKEYAAVLAQLNNEKADATRAEARAMELMAQLEQRKTALTKLEQTSQAEEHRLEDLQARLAQTRDSYAQRLAQLEQRRAQAAAAFEASIVTLFDRLSERYDGEVMAEVCKPDARNDEYICGGCNMALRAEVYNSLRVRDEVLTCNSCGRILYLSD